MMLHWELRGKGKPLVFLHGWGADLRIWQRQVEYFSQDHCALTLDLPGHGKSAWEERKDFLSYTKEYIISLCKKYNFVEPVLIGWSFACLLLFKLAEDSSFKIGSLVLVSGTPKFIATDGFPFGFNLKNIRFLRKQINNNLKLALQEFYDSFFTSQEKKDTYRLGEPFPKKEALLSTLDILKRSDFRKSLSKIDIPTLIICGGKDPLIPQEASLYMHRIIKKSSLVIIKETGHLPFLTKPAEFNHELEKWISQR